MAKWTLKESLDVPASIAHYPLPPAVLQILVSRGVNDEKKIERFLAPDYERDMHDPFLFTDMEKVIGRIRQAKDKSETVVVFGDYDADGITASTIMQLTLDEIGVDSFVYIPNKKTEGYGLNMEAIEEFHKKNVALIITVDCGITSIEEVAKARTLGIDVIITDHHHVPAAVPAALAIINPHQNKSGYPFADLAGVGVSFKVVQAIYERMLPEKKQQTRWLLDLVAIGTIADCVPLVGENRVLAAYGLRVLAKTKRVGLHELFAVGRMVVNENNVPDVRAVAFQIAPRINAAGRINHANLAYDLIRETNQAKARGFALELEANNTQRQKITQQITDEVKIVAENMFKDRKFIFAAGEHFPAGVLGLVAGKIAQQFNKPAAIFQKEPGVYKGSLRSIPKINIIETIEQCKHCVLKFGGHSQAAGVSVAAEKMDEFCACMETIIEKELEGIDCSPEIMIDAELSGGEIGFEMVEAIEKMKPFGEGNRPPVFLATAMTVREMKTVGNGNKHTKLFLKPDDNTPKLFEAIAFNSTEKLEAVKIGDRVDMVFALERDDWNGNSKLQLVVEDVKKVL